MYKIINKDTIQSNLNNIVENGLFYDLYNRTMNSGELEEMESKSTQIFNAALFTCQLVENPVAIKEVMMELLQKANFDSYTGTLASDNFSAKQYVQILKQYDSFYVEDGMEKMLHRLKHGVAVHFTTPRIMEKIEEDRVLYAYSSMFAKEIEDKILKAGEYQREHSEEARDTLNFLHQGFGFSKGISMGAQAAKFWMHHTPESLTFLFGGKVFTRNKKGAMEHVDEAISTLPDDRKGEMRELLEHIWDDLIGQDESLGCVLIDRDALEYEKVTYWNEEPPRVEEVRPYRNNNFSSLGYTEETRYIKDIPVSGLKFVKIPSIIQLEKYRRAHPIPKEDKIVKKSMFDDISFEEFEVDIVGLDDDEFEI